MAAETMPVVTETMPVVGPLQLQLFDKLLQIPLVDLAYSTSTDVYQKMKGCHGIINWTLGSAEGAAALAFLVVAPVASKLKGPIHYVDDTLCKGIDAFQEKVPIVKEPPHQIVEDAVNYVSNSAAVERVQNITNVGWEKANEVLSTTTVGNMTLNGLDTTSNLADRVIDYCLPAGENEENVHPHPSSECEDKVLHAAHTVGTLSAKVSRRLYNSISRRQSSAPRFSSQSSDDTITSGTVSQHSSDEEDN